ncbi:carbohydrate ABC transporter permease [Clostridium oryzae]|uniref:sn-glycerol-3-phosphate transport system permease protein UgpA n=1 Tax=Clostridium oryzae TaxID=1450648 RepID=A0A1V4IF47_9CLOT|nr:sugar ABC transporter permease [Clostridium oryzae]OPJ58556.1 sn-glycerol-3-phosphate transport system permease protein UgpA [Clostridium oryzae]
MKVKSKNKIGSKKTTVFAYMLILPSLLVFAVFMFYPLIRTIYLSFFSWNMIKPTKDFVGLNNYMQLFKDPITYKIMANTMFYIVILLVLNWVAPYILSFILAVIIKKGKGFYKSAIFLPSVISLVVGSILYLWILNPISGPAAILAKALGITLPIWSKTDGLVIVVLSIITTWKVFGYNFIVVLSGVMGVSSEVIEAAKLDKVPMHRIFIDIVLPMSSATGIYVFIMTVVQGLQYVFTPIKVITQGGPNYASSNAIYNSYHEAFTLYRTGRASAFAVVTMAIFILLLILEFKYVERSVYYEN